MSSYKLRNAAMPGPLKISCWPGYKAEGQKKSPSGAKTAGGNIKMVNNCVKK